jgi:hypothetical protein
MYLVALSRIEVLLKSVLYPVLNVCSITADFYGWPRCVYLVYFLHLVLMDLAVHPTYTPLHS